MLALNSLALNTYNYVTLINMGMNTLRTHFLTRKTQEEYVNAYITQSCIKHSYNYVTLIKKDVMNTLRTLF